MYWPFFYDWTYILLIPALILSMWAQFRVSSTFSRFSKVRASSGMTATQMAEQLLHAEGVYDVSVERTRGNLTDHYDPKNMVLRLSDSTANSTSVAALGVAAHEAGHVLQHRDGYAPLMLRTAAVPVVNIGSELWMLVLLAGIFMNLTGLINLGILLFAFVVVFQLVTLPVEFNASARAMNFISNDVRISPEQARGARQMLTAAALTYVAAALSSILQLLYLLQQRQDD